MRPLKLSFQAFKSFPDHHEIDFSALSTKGVFLIVGNTGAGKSTIFDAMCWALFGEFPGEGRRRGDPRSHHAPADRQTFVELIFEAQGTRYLVRREADQERAKSGAKTKKTGGAVLSRLDDGGTEEIAVLKTNVTHACERIVGLNLKQFEKVVLLPQGDFAKFLTSDDADREEVLRQLFDGHLYMHATALLKTWSEERQEAQGKREDEIRSDRRAAINALTEVMESRSLIPLSEEVPDDVFDATLMDLGAMLAEEESAHASLDDEARSADRDAATASEGARLFDEYRSLVDRQKELTAERTSMEKRRARVERSKRARPVKDSQGEVSRIEGEVHGLDDDLKKAQAASKRLRTKLDSKRQQREKKASVTESVEELTATLRSWDELIEAVGHHAAASRDHADAEAELDRLTVEYNATQAARLAASLKPGAACLVCGSPTHPAPAKLPRGTSHVGDAQVETARTTERDRAAAMTSTMGTVQRLRGILALDAEDDLSDLGMRRERSAASLQKAVKAQAAIEVLEADIRALEGDSEAADEEEARLGGDMKARKGALAEVRRQMAKLLKKSGFTDVASASSAVLDPRTEELEEKAVASWDQDRYRVEARLAALRADEGHPIPRRRPASDALKGIADARRTAANEALQRCQQLGGALRAARKDMGKARRLEASLKAVRAEADLYRTVFETCEKNNGLRMTLERWILADELDRVVAQGNMHLRKMTKGRYALQRAATRKGPDSLELDILDSHTGRDRPTTTLSGGEKFLASLSLALGLADVISHGGSGSGLTYQALFVDEGFDALSDDFLELAANTLSELQAEGRMVAAITHILGMRERLPVGIQVRRLYEEGPSTLEVR